MLEHLLVAGTVASEPFAVDRRQHQVEWFAGPEVGHVLSADTGIGQRHHHGCPLTLGGAFSVPDLRNTPRLIGAGTALGRHFVVQLVIDLHLAGFADLCEVEGNLQLAGFAVVDYACSYF